MPVHIHMKALPSIVYADIGNSFPPKVDPTTPEQRLRGMFAYLNELYVAMGEPQTMASWDVEAMTASLQNYLNESRMYKGHVVKPISRCHRKISLNGEWVVAWVMQQWVEAQRAISKKEEDWADLACKEDPFVPEFKIHGL